ncbi:MAG: double-strand break repair helicase AddA [Alphaproteobacteria bacterium]|nr:double-strand break repair helicase AddA [Alphaproteobacteria bacterium]MBQ8678079.1 double-strand break repair helicase AddA [Alphaproteobacteria bacterium]
MSRESCLKEREMRSRMATEQQRRASNPFRSVWVEASAGTGKTKVLSDRVLRLLLSGVAPSKILCLTYTKAAAVEMNDRIARRLSQWAVINDEDLDKQLQVLLGKIPDDQKEYQRLTASARRLFAELLDTPGGMKIQTLHSFCQEVLKRFPLEAKISPYFEVMDDRAKNEILEHIKTQMLVVAEKNKEQESAAAVGYLTSHINEISFPDLMSAITENAGKIIQLFRSYPKQEDLLNELARKLDVNPSDSEESLKKTWFQCLDINLLRQMLGAWFKGSKSDVQKAEILAPLLERPFELSDYGCLYHLFLTSKGELCALKTYATKGALAVFPDLANEALKMGQSLLDLENKLTAVRVYDSTKAVIKVAQELIGEYQKYKFEHAKMDYDDLIMLTRQLLEDKSVADWVLFKLDGGIDNVLIDEAQDTSPHQWAIIRSLTQEFFDESRGLRTIFVVGDRKQSIYSFQGADPREFDKMRSYFREKASRFDEVNLDISFRSVPAVMDCVNTVFSTQKTTQGVLADGEKMAHLPFRSGEAGKIEIWPLVEREKDDEEEGWLPPVERKKAESSSSRLAKMIATRIKQMVGREDLISQGRKVCYKDFLILVQRRNAFVDELVRECKQAGVSIAGVDKIKLLEQVAVQDLVALGKFLLLPTDDLTLAVVLKSPLFGLTDDDLFSLCYQRGQASVWTRLGDNPKYREIYQILQSLLNKADYIRPFELYAYVLGTLEGRKNFEKRMGTEVDDGIDEFINLTLTFEQEHIPTLQGFINWIGQDEVEIKREQEQSDVDAVRIMTVHGSKGLQAPIVILPDTVRQVNSKKSMGMLWDDIFYYPLCAADYEKNCLRVKAQEHSDEMDEYRRLLYVALTRAEDRLCICGYGQKNKPKDDCWYMLCTEQMKSVSQEDSDGNLIYNSAQEIDVKGKSAKIMPELLQENIPDWLTERVVPESPLAKPYTPSKPDETDEDDALFSPLTGENNNRYRRGLVIHRLLQFLPDVNSKDKRGVIREFLRQNATDFSEQQKQKIEEEVLFLVTNPQFAPLFSNASKAEVPLMGEVDGKIISGQIDRLVVLEKEVWIVDFKTNRPAAHSPQEVQQAYIKQLAAYKALLTRIYPLHTIKTFLLWTDTAQIMPLSV